MLDVRIIVVLWALEIPRALWIVWNWLAFALLPLVDRDSNHIRFPRPSLSESVDVALHVANLIGIVLSFIEVHKYRNNRLRPPFFTLSHGFRALSETAAFSSMLHMMQRHGVPYFVIGRQFTFCIVFLVCFYGGFMYGSWCWHLYRRGGASIDTADYHLDQETSLVPRKIMTASSLTSRGAMMSIIVNWIYRPVFTNADRSGNSLIVRPINFVGFIAKYILGSMALVPLAITPRQLPGEIKIETLGSKQSKWDYNSPKLGRHDHSRDEHQSFAPLRERRLLHEIDHESDSPPRPSDLMSLHSIQQPINAEEEAWSTLDSDEDVSERHLGPRLLCFLDPSRPKGYVVRRTSDWAKENGSAHPDYVFISYTRIQFFTTISGDPSLPSDINPELQAAAERDMHTLVEFALRATEAASASAFWIDYECVQPDIGASDDESMEDVYRICDIVRACHSMAIIVGPRFVVSKFGHEAIHPTNARAEWLRDWGSRLWTVPEALLCPAEHRISIYAVGTSEPEFVAKRNLPSRVWDDAASLRQLIDHYESSIHLTKLELITIALDCLKRRQTQKRMAGDVAYALQGLLRQRPKVSLTDTDFQAFARLSLANDSDMLLERLLSLRPRDARAPWHDMKDIWGAKLWDIFPLCQIADVVEDDTVIVGDTKGAVINWSFLEAIDYQPTKKHRAYWLLVRIGPMLFLVYGSAMLLALALLLTNGSEIEVSDKAIAFLSIFLAVTIPGILIVPWILRRLHRVEIHETQARLYGIAGHPDLGQVEELLFGSDLGRLQWVPGAGISNDLHVTEPDTSGNENDGKGLMHFTLIDTCTLSAIPFEAENPPSVALACARARGLVRVLLCSYDMPATRLCKEAVIRMETLVLDRMPKLDRFRFTLKPPREEVDDLALNS